MGIGTKIKAFFGRVFGWVGKMFSKVFASDEFKTFCNSLYKTVVGLVLSAAGMEGDGAAKRQYVIDGMKKYADENKVQWAASFGNLLVELVVNDLKIDKKL